MIAWSAAAQQLRQHRAPVYIRHDQVKDDEVIIVGQGAAKAAWPVRDGVGVISGTGQGTADEITDPRLVLDQQDPQPAPAGWVICRHREYFASRRPHQRVWRSGPAPAPDRCTADDLLLRAALVKAFDWATKQSRYLRRHWRWSAGT